MVCVCSAGMLGSEERRNSEKRVRMMVMCRVFICFPRCFLVFCFFLALAVVGVAGEVADDAAAEIIGLTEEWPDDGT